MTVLPRVHRPKAISLSARLLGMVALSTAVVVGGTTLVQRKFIVGAVEDEAIDTAGATAIGVASELTEKEDLPSSGDLDEMLADFSRMVPALRALTVTRLDADGSIGAVASTDARLPDGVRALSRDAIAARDRAVSGPLPGPVRMVAVPLERNRRPYGAVVVTISMDAVQRVRDEVRWAALLFTPLAILILTAMLHLLARDLVLSPVNDILFTMERASAGDLTARARIRRRDEIGAVADGLNAMLERVADFNAELQREVRQSTEELRETNRQLADTAQRLFGARRDLARSEQLAVAGQMAASVAHQIGTPLNLISGYVQMILTELPADSAPAVRLRTVQEQIRKVTTIVHGLLDQARRPLLHRAPVAARELVGRVCELARPTLEAAGIRLRTVLVPDLPLLDVDAGQLEQVFLNLITNSVDAMPNGGELVVTAGLSGGHVEITVADSGAGIDPAHVTRVFDPLFTTKERGKGTGLGLTIARDVVGAHGGTISVASRRDEGTTVTVRLPVAVRAEASHG